MAKKPTWVDPRYSGTALPRQSGDRDPQGSPANPLARGGKQAYVSDEYSTAGPRQGHGNEALPLPPQRPHGFAAERPLPEHAFATSGEDMAPPAANREPVDLAKTDVSRGSFVPEKK